jgi:EmrB/QacA subfamily drug resistance transporter
MTDRARAFWALVVTSTALFMSALDNLVVTTALPTIRADLHASLGQLEWTVNAYTLTFAVLLLTGAALGERFGRRRMFVAGLAVFTAGSAAAALAPTVGWLIAARAAQGIGGAVITPLTLTLLSAAVPPRRRGMALGVWGAVAGLAVAMGPLVGGAVVEGASWQWIFWLNVPVGLALLPLARTRLRESRGPARRLDLPGVALGSAGLFGVVFALVRGNSVGWFSAEVVGGLAGGAALLAAFVGWELRSEQPMLPMRLFRSRGFTATNVASGLMYVGMFGSIFLLAQYLQTVLGYSPLATGVRILPWTAMPAIVAPIAARLAERYGGRTVVATGLGLQGAALLWMASISTAHLAYADLVPALAIAGIGMGLFFAPVANVVLSSVRSSDEGVASGVTNAIRELGGVFGVAVLAAVFSGQGGYGSAGAFVAGLQPAVAVGGALVLLGALAMLAAPLGRGAPAAKPAVAANRADVVSATPESELVMTR